MDQRSLLIAHVGSLRHLSRAFATGSEPPVRQPSGTASAGWQVVDQESGMPLVGVDIQIASARRGTTGPETHFHLDGLPVGPCRLRFS